MEIPCDSCNLKDSCEYREKILTIISRERGLDVDDDCTKIIKTVVTIRQEMLQGDSPPAIMIGRVVFVAPKLIIYL